MTEQNFYASANSKLDKPLKTVGHAHHSTANFLSNTDPGINVRPGSHRSDYEFYRPGEAIPKTDADIMIRCRDSYEKIGLIKSVIDLMTEIAVEGIQLVSDNPAIENFYNNWSQKVNLQERAERFASHILIEGNAVVRKKVGRIDTPQVRRMKRNQSLTKTSIEVPEIANEPGVIPIEYIFYDPATIELIGGELATFTGLKQYGIKISNNTISSLNRVSNPDRERLMSLLPEEIRDVLNGGARGKSTMTGSGIVIPIDSDRLYVGHAKKRDSDVWAKSIVYSILHEVIYNEKLRMAKLAALDGWHHPIRIWKLGDHQQEILPDEGAFAKLSSILQHQPHGVIDILWDTMIDMDEHYPPIEQLSGFEENFEAIMLGLGVPRTLVGGSEAAGLTNMFIGLRNMMKRIDGIRRQISLWLNSEIDFISDNLGFQTRPYIKFSLSNLFDQQSYFKLLMDLYDRQVISDKSILEKIGEISEVERVRTKDEFDLRDNGEIAPRRNPLEQPVIPQENREWQKESSEHQQDLQEDSKDKDVKREKESGDGKEEDTKQKPQKKKGRPPGSVDNKPRLRRFRSKAGLMVLGNQIQDKLDKLVDPAYLGYNKVSTKRNLTSSQKKELEEAKLEMLASLDTDDFELDSVSEKLDDNKIYQFKQLYNQSVSHTANPTSADLKMIRSVIYAEIYGENCE